MQSFELFLPAVGEWPHLLISAHQLLERPSQIPFALAPLPLLGPAPSPASRAPPRMTPLEDR